MKKIVLSLILMFFINSVAYCNYENVEKERIFGVCKNENQCGVISSTNRIVLPYEYNWINVDPGTIIDSVKYFIAAKPKNDRIKDLFNVNYGIIDKQGKILIDFKYDFIFETDVDYFIVEKNDEYGIIDIKGKEIIPIKYKRIQLNKEGLAIVSLNDREWGVIDVGNGKEIIPSKYGKIRDIGKGNFEVCKNGKCGMIDKNGKTIIELENKHVYSNETDIICVENRYGKIGFYDIEGKLIIPFEYKAVHKTNLYKEGLGVVKNEENKWGYINKEGEVVIPFKYKNALNFQNGYAQVYLDKKIFYINKEGEKVLPFVEKTKQKELLEKFDKYDKYTYKDGVYYVIDNQKEGIVDTNGKIIVPIEYKLVYLEKNGYYKAENLDGEYAFYKKDGTLLYKTNAQFAQILDENVIEINEMRKKPTQNAGTVYNLDEGAVDFKGDEIIPITYDRLEYYKTGYFIVTKNGKIGIIDKKGKKVIPFKKYVAFCTESGIYTKDY